MRENVRLMVSGNARILIIGDLHISDRPSKRHRDYEKQSFELLDKITAMLEAQKITHFILLGDLFGRLSEKNLQTREALMKVLGIFQHWNRLTNGNVYSVEGNHDQAEKLTDYELLRGLGLIKNPLDLDIGAIRFHFLNYGEVRREIELREDAYNVALAHAELLVEGGTTWFFNSKEGVELSSLENLYGVDWVLCGHIHHPSVRLLTTSIRDKDVNLFYLGCANPTSYTDNLWENAFALFFETDNNDVSMNQFYIPVPSGDELFIEDAAKSLDIIDDEDGALFDIEQLSDILNQLNAYNLIGDGAYKTQIQRMGGLDTEAVELALKYVEQAEGKLK